MISMGLVGKSGSFATGGAAGWGGAAAGEAAGEAAGDAAGLTAGEAAGDAAGLGASVGLAGAAVGLGAAAGWQAINSAGASATSKTPQEMLRRKLDAMADLHGPETRAGIIESHQSPVKRWRLHWV
jgi:hypothetical protein